MDNALDQLRDAVLGGRACLVLGQDHTAGHVTRVLTTAAGLAGGKPYESLPSLYCALGDNPEARHAIYNVMLEEQPGVSLMEIASLPWTSVVTTAVDPLILAALRSAGSQRKVIELGATQVGSVDHARSVFGLHVIRAFGSAAESSGPLAPPSSVRELNRARTLSFPGVVQALPRLIGLDGVVVIEGMSGRDWADPRTLTALTALLADLPPGRAFWFGYAPAEVRADLEHTVHFEADSVAQTLLDWTRHDATREALQARRLAVFGATDRVVTYREGAGSQRVGFSVDEWRSVSRIAAILDDESFAVLKLEKDSDRRLALGKFLRGPHVGIPDWHGVAQGYCFERNTVRNLVESIEQFLSGPKQSLHAPSAGRGSRAPRILTGPPASGKTVGILHAAWALREKQRFVLWLRPGVGGVDPVAIERVCRLIEGKGVPWLLLFADGLQLDGIHMLRRTLEAAGRNVVLVGTESRIVGPDRGIPDDGWNRYLLSNRLSVGESAGFVNYLGRSGVATPSAFAGATDFLDALSLAVPEARLGALPPLLAEYERALVEAARSTAAPAPRAGDGSLGAQLTSLLPKLQLASSPSALESAPLRFQDEAGVREILDLILFCAQLEEHLPVDVLLHVGGSRVLRDFPGLCAAFKETALIYEVRLDEEGSTALTTTHQLPAQWLLRALYPSRADQLAILERMAMAVEWRTDARRGEHGPQDFVIALLRSVGPRGAFEHLYRSVRAEYAAVLAKIRETYGHRSVQLMSLEAIVYGDMAREQSKAGDGCAVALGLCDRARELLDEVERILSERPPSPARNFEMQRALTLSADISGTRLNAILPEVLTEPTPSGLAAVVTLLAEIENRAQRAHSLDPQFHPMDVLFWAKRDVFDALRRLPGWTGGPRLLEGMASALETADEFPIEERQVPNYNKRAVELSARKGQVDLSTDLARKMREGGDYSGEVALARYGIAQATAKQRAEIHRQEFDRLSGFVPGILRDIYAIRFLMRLWSEQFVSGRLGEGGPKTVSAGRIDWEALATLATARLAFPSDEEDPQCRFWLGWAQYQLGRAREARETFQVLDRLSVGHPRRVGDLVWITTPDGRPRRCSARVVHAQQQKIRLQLLEFDATVDLRPEEEVRLSASGLALGEIVEVWVSLNYRGVQVHAPGEHS